MIAVVEQWNVIRPLIAWEFIKAFHYGSPPAVGQKTQHPWNDDWIVQLLLFHVRLADNDEGRAFLGIEQAFHRGESNRLPEGYHLSLLIPGWKQLEQAEDQAGSHAELQKYPGVLHVFDAEHVEGANCGDRKGTGYDRAAHVVCVLPKDPRVQY